MRLKRQYKVYIKPHNYLNLNKHEQLQAEMGHIRKPQLIYYFRQ